VADRTPRGAGRGAQAPLSPLIHGRVRLLILCRLVARPGGATFTELKQALDLTDGTLSVHLGKLADGGLVTISKEFAGKKPQTLARLSVEGRRQFARYVDELRALVPGLGGPRDGSI
jgi:DNA-binding transcriptional ArsR family regulator